MSRELIDRTQGKWRDILSSLGIDASCLTGKHRPCPICGGKDRFRFDDKRGSGSFFCSQCGSGYGVHLVARYLNVSLQDAMATVEARLGDISVKSQTGKPDEGQSKTGRPSLKEVWDEGTPLSEETLAWRYLQSRGLLPDLRLRALRFSGRQMYLDHDGNFAGRLPCMLGLIQGSDDKLVGLHRTYLAKDGSGQASVPYPKKVLGMVPDGSAIRLFKRERHLGVAEGIETAISAYRLFGIPTWATVTAGGMEKWLPPDGVEQVTVFGDDDKSFTGQKAAYTLANKLSIKGYHVDVRIPETSGWDWNDSLCNSLEGRR